MPKQIEQSRKHGHWDPRWTSRSSTASDDSRTDELAGSDATRPALKLVGGTDLEQTPPVRPLAQV